MADVEKHNTDAKQLNMARLRNPSFLLAHTPLKYTDVLVQEEHFRITALKRDPHISNLCPIHEEGTCPGRERKFAFLFAGEIKPCAFRTQEFNEISFVSVHALPCTGLPRSAQVIT